MTTTGLFDRQAFAERIGHDEATFRELVDLFCEMQPARMDALAQAVADEALADTRVHAHTLAGTFRNMSLDRLGDLAKALERAAVDGDVALVQERFLALDALFLAALDELEAVRVAAGATTESRP
jgi:HPt (histidine-containing phosphotransfer) domain-containing protein